MKYQYDKIIPFVLSVFVFSGCWVEPNDDEVTEEELEAYAASYGADVDVSLSDSSDGSQITISNMNLGGTQLGADLGLPDGFPADVVVYPGTRIVSSTPVPNGFVVSAQSDEKASVIASYLEQEMKKNGWTMKPHNAQSELMKALQFSKGTRMANISLVAKLSRHFNADYYYAFRLVNCPVMLNVFVRLVVLSVCLFVSQQSFGLTCDPTPDRHAVRISAGPVNALHSNDATHSDPFVELYGDASFYQELETGWVFVLLKQKDGWSLRLRENDSASAVDLSAITPPYQRAPNPRDIFGWHFRNRNNSGTNTGEVNAPQQLRLFSFSQGLMGTGGFKPSIDSEKPRFEAPVEDEGRGWLQILDYGLRNSNPGDVVHMNYLKFSACLTWPKSDEETATEFDLASTRYTDEDKELFGACGLNLGEYELHATRLPRYLSADFDNDGALDVVVQVRRVVDGRLGIAVCRAGTWLNEFGYSEAKNETLNAAYIQRVESWELVAADHGLFGYVDEAPWPPAEGDVLVLDRIEKERVLLYWHNNGFHSRQAFRFIEP